MTGWKAQPASEKQIAFLTTLIAERESELTEIPEGLTKGMASALITGLKAEKKKGKAKATPAPAAGTGFSADPAIPDAEAALAEIEAPGYALGGEDTGCLDYGRSACKGKTEYRVALSSTGKSFQRCEKHWDERLAEQERIQSTYGGAAAPSWFDPTYAGESW